MIGGIERVRDVIAGCPTGRTVHAQSDDVRDVLTALDLAEAAVTRAHAALATERERAEAATTRADAAEAECARLRACLARANGTIEETERARYAADDGRDAARAEADALRATMAVVWREMEAGQ